MNPEYTPIVFAVIGVGACLGVIALCMAAIDKESAPRS
jgi:hypothetical protein